LEVELPNNYQIKSVLDATHRHPTRPVADVHVQSATGKDQVVGTRTDHRTAPIVAATAHSPNHTEFLGTAVDPAAGRC